MTAKTQMSSEDRVNKPSSKKTDVTRRIQVLNRKGGAGKTTTTGNTAEALGQMGYRVLVVDMDANASLTLGLGIRPAELQYSIYDLLMSPSSLLATRDVIVDLPHVHFDLLPGSVNLSYAEPSLLMASKQHALKERLSEVDGSYDFVLIDTAGHESFMSTLSHVYSDEAVLPTEADIVHWEALEETLASIKKVRENGLNPNLRVRTIVVTRYQPRTVFGDAMVTKLQSEYGDLLFSTLVMATVRVKTAQGRGRPVVAHDPSAQASVAYMRLAEFLINE